MTLRRVLPILVVALAAASPATAQRFSVGPFGGAYLADDDAAHFGTALEPRPGPPTDPGDPYTTTGFLVGLRAGYGIRGRWTLEAGYGRAAYETAVTVNISTVLDPVGREVSLEIAEHRAHLYYGAVRYDIRRGEFRPYVLLGVGGVNVTTSSSVPFSLAGDVSFADPVLAVGAGFSADIAPRTRLRGDLRDHIQFCSAEDDLCEEDQALHNFEISGGVEIAF